MRPGSDVRQPLVLLAYRHGLRRLVIQRHDIPWSGYQVASSAISASVQLWRVEDSTARALFAAITSSAASVPSPLACTLMAFSDLWGSSSRHPSHIAP